MSIAECYVINAQCDDTLHGDHVVREQFTGATKREANAALRRAGWRRIGDDAVRCPACRKKHGERALVRDALAQGRF